MAKSKNKKSVDRPTLPLSFVAIVPQSYAAQLRCIRREWERPDSHQWNWVAAYYYQNVLARMAPIMRSDIPKLLTFGDAIVRATPAFRVTCRGFGRDRQGRKLYTRLEANSELEALQGRLDRPLRSSGLIASQASNPSEIVVAIRFDDCPNSMATPTESLRSMKWGSWVVSKLHLVEALDGHGPMAYTILRTWELPRTLF